MATQPERIIVLETKVENIEHKLDELKQDIKENNQEIKDQLKGMYEASCTQHAELGKKLNDLEKFKWQSTAIVGFILIVLTALANVSHIISIFK